MEVEPRERDSAAERERAYVLERGRLFVSPGQATPQKKKSGRTGEDQEQRENPGELISAYSEFSL